MHLHTSTLVIDMDSHWLIFFTSLIALVAARGEAQKIFRPDYEYNSDADGWFKLHTIPATWEDARHRCYFEGAVLASPPNTKIAYVLNSTRRSGPVYLGVHAISSGGYFSVEGVPLRAMPITWDIGEPDNKGNTERCTVCNSTGRMADVDCSLVYPYICYKKRIVDMVQTECGTVDTKYKLDQRTGKCYKFHGAGMPWPRAMMACVAEGGHLAVINSDVEAQVIKDVFAQNPASTITSLYGDVARLGFYEWDETGIWGTIHGQSLEEAGYAKWKAGEPNNIVLEGKKQRCGGAYRDGLFDNLYCDFNFAFICEKDPKSLSYNK